MGNNEILALVAVAILLPALSAALCYLIRSTPTRKFIVLFTALVMFVVAGILTQQLIKSPNGKLTPTMNLDFVGWIIKFLDMVLMIYIIYTGVRLRKALIVTLASIQLIALVIFEVFGTVEEPKTSFVIDYLSLVMILLVSIIGPIISIFAMGYMKEHEHHLGLQKSRQPRFFMIIFVFLAAMNALVMTNNLSWMFFFWEVTTLCSFLLISHDGNTESVKNASRALWMNLVGGVAFVFAMIIIYNTTHTLAIDEIVGKGLVGLLPIALLCFAGFTKSAQFPFQSWLLGAMVAPTPVSALLHSSTMVKAGVYLIVRLVPAYAGTVLGTVVAVVGGFTFMAASAVAISQSNGKRVLAYSTIANLGLIICCAGIGNYVSLAAAVLLMIFHAVSKGLLFLCVGTIEQGIGSRDIEDMQGLMKRMPFTTVITVIGMISMLLPPFGVLITKWLTIESSTSLPLVMMFIILGSAFTVVFWSKWLGIILTMSYKPKHKIEHLTASVKGALSALFVGVLAASILIVPLFNNLIKPYLQSLGNVEDLPIGGSKGGIWITVGNAVFGGFASLLFFGIIFILMITIPIFLKRTKAESIKPPYLCGENINNDVRGLEFYSPAEKVEKVVVRNYYLGGIFGEKNLTPWLNFISGAIILIMFGAVIK
ncbi:MAG: proton-conducting transporter membrane subunit [Bacillota bacterium]|nr:proton-conducting transporter membrane subunit [Bacillota bacterium]